MQPQLHLTGITGLDLLAHGNPEKQCHCCFSSSKCYILRQLPLRKLPFSRLRTVTHFTMKSESLLLLLFSPLTVLAQYGRGQRISTDATCGGVRGYACLDSGMLCVHSCKRRILTSIAFGNCCSQVRSSDQKLFRITEC